MNIVQLNSVTLALVFAITQSAPAIAQQTTNSQSITPERFALTATDLGPEWSLREQHVNTIDGVDSYQVIYASVAKSTLQLTTALAGTPHSAEMLVSNLRSRFQQHATLGQLSVSSIAEDTFMGRAPLGDGEAFKVVSLEYAQAMTITYAFRVGDVFAVVDYRLEEVSTRGANKIHSQAAVFARQQETKLRTAIAPPS